jgi:hypothetical protein
VLCLHQRFNVFRLGSLMKNDIEIRLSQLKEQLPTIARSAPSLFYRYLLWNQATWICPTQLNEFNAISTYVGGAREVNSQANKQAIEIKQEILKKIHLASVDIEKEIFPLCEKLIETINTEFQDIQTKQSDASYELNVLDANNLTEYRIFLNQLYRFEYDFRLNTSILHTFTDVLVDSLDELKAIAPKDKATQERISQFIETAEKSAKDLQTAVSYYEECKKRLNDEIPQKKEELRKNARLQFEKTVKSMEVKVQILNAMENRNLRISQESEQASQLLDAMNNAGDKFLEKDEITIKDYQDRYNEAISKFHAIYTQKQFESALELVDEKVKQLKEKSNDSTEYGNAHKTASQLLETLKQAGLDYFNKEDSISTDDFSKRCHDAIDAAKPVLSMHRGWKDILAKIACVVMSIVTIGIAPAFNKLATGHWRFFTPKTDSQKVLDTMEHHVDVERPVVI